MPKIIINTRSKWILKVHTCISMFICYFCYCLNCILSLRLKEYNLRSQVHINFLLIYYFEILFSKQHMCLLQRRITWTNIGDIKHYTLKINNFSTLLNISIYRICIMVVNTWGGSVGVSCAEHPGGPEGLLVPVWPRGCGHWATGRGVRFRTGTYGHLGIWWRKSDKGRIVSICMQIQTQTRSGNCPGTVSHGRKSWHPMPFWWSKCWF